MSKKASTEQLIELAMHLERESARKIISEVSAIAEERVDAHWAGFSAACEEIMFRLETTWGER